MKAHPAGAADQIDFKFADVTQLKSPGVEHMHDASIRFVDPDHLHHE